MKYSYYLDSCHSWLVCLLGFWLRNALLVKVIRNPIVSFSFFTVLDAYEAWKVSSDSALTWWFSGAASPLVSLSNFCIWCLFVCFSGFKKSNVVYATSLCTFVRFETMIWPSKLIRFDISLSLQNFKKPFRHFLTADRKKTSRRRLRYNCDCKKKALSDILASRSSWKNIKHREAGQLKT